MLSNVGGTLPLPPAALGGFRGELRPLARAERGGPSLPALEATESAQGDRGGVLDRLGLILEFRGLAGRFADDLEGDLTEVSATLPRHERQYRTGA